MAALWQSPPKKKVATQKPGARCMIRLYLLCSTHFNLHTVCTRRATIANKKIQFGTPIVIKENKNVKTLLFVLNGVNSQKNHRRDALKPVRANALVNSVCEDAQGSFPPDALSVNFPAGI